MLSSAQKSSQMPQRIKQLGQAIFYVYDESGNRVAAGLIQTENIDENGNIWFTMQRLPLVSDSTRYIGELVFYRKGIPYFISVFGTAALKEFEPLLVQFTVSHIDYREWADHTSVGELVLKLPVLRLLSPSFYHERPLRLQ